jgi:hypothetical protein
MPGDLTDLGATMEVGMALVILSAHAAGAATPDQKVALQVLAHREVGPDASGYVRTGDPTALLDGIFDAMGPDYEPPEAVVDVLKKYDLRVSH